MVKVLSMIDSEVSNYWVKCISTHGNIRGVAIQATQLVQSMADLHQLKNDAARGLGESVIGALLIASHCKKGQRINLNIRGSGNLQQALVDANPDGTVRGYVIERQTEIPLDDGAGPWGTGLLSVLRTREEEADKPYIGTVPLLTGHLAKDLSFYWVQSEQIPSAVGLAVQVENGKVKSAGGFLVQALPGASEQEIKMIEKHIHEIQSLTENFSANGSPVHLLSQIFQSTAFMVIEEKPLEFKCNCSWEKVHKALTLVGVDELQSILTEDQVALVNCEFCSKEYRVESDALKKLIQDVSK